MLGKYRIDARLGKGGMSVVYQAEDTLLQRAVAIKILPRQLSSDPVTFERFLFEARAVARLNHPNIVHVYDINEIQGGWYLVMELVAGGSAQEALRKHGPLPWEKAVAIATDACRGLVAAHEAGIIHRDIKPGNILLTPENVAKLADFGLAKALDANRPMQTAHDTVLGTPAFMSPEQCRSHPLDPRTDIYSLGATLFTLLTGRAPFEAASALDVLYAHCNAPRPDPRTVVAGIPARVVALIQLAMAIAPGERFATARDMLVALERLAPGRDSATPGPVRDAEPVVAAIPVAEPVRKKKPTEAAARDTQAGKRGSSPRPKADAPSYTRRWILGGLVGVACTGGAALWMASRSRSREPNPVSGPVADPWWKRVPARGHVFPALDGTVLTVAVSPDLHWAAALTERKSLYVWDLHTGQLVPNLGPIQIRDTPRSLVFTNDSKTLVTGLPNRLLLLTPATSQKIDQAVPLPRPGVLACLAAMPDSENLLLARLASSSANCELMLAQNLGASLVPGAIHTAPGPFIGGVVTPDHKEIITLSADGTLRAFDAQRLTPLRSGKQDIVEKLGRGPAYGLAVTPTEARPNKPSGAHLVVADERGLIFLRCDDWAARIALELGSAHCVAYSPTSQFWAAGLTRGRIYVRNNVSGQDFELTGHDGTVLALAFASQGSLLISGGDDRTVRVWNYSEIGS
jgi:serine/threonine protein kinase